MEFSHYEEVPPAQAEKIIAKSRLKKKKSNYSWLAGQQSFRPFLGYCPCQHQLPRSTCLM